MEHDSLIEKEDFQVETRFGSYRLKRINKQQQSIHIANKGLWNTNEHVLTRINSTLVIMIF
jgi:3,4-dihydroxy 2-butanone 4-phosphate synthase/GTP cyclohydrolase II